MIRTMNSAGTLLFGRGMIAQLTIEIHLAGASNPAIVCLAADRRKARRVARQLAPGFVKSLPLFTGDVPRGFDFLILAGGGALADRYSGDSRLKALLPLDAAQLKEIHRPLCEFLILDTWMLKGDDAEYDELFRRYARACTDGAASVPATTHIPPSFSYSCRTRVISGEGSLSKLPSLLTKAGVRRPLVLSDRGLTAAGLVKRLTDVLIDFEVHVFDGIPPDSGSHVVDGIVDIYRETNRDCIIALGGGSVLDTGKGVYLGVSLEAGPLIDQAGSNRIPRLHTPFFAIPTTSGTGSEVTKVAVVSDADQGRKVLYVSPNLQPDAAILDGELSTGLPPFLTSITGMDALSHAVEAFTCIGRNPLSDQMALGAVEKISANLIPMMDNLQYAEMRGEMALASSLAGQAFSNSMVGMVHSIGHSLGAVCHAPHGACMSVLLPVSLEFNFNCIQSRLAVLLPALVGEEAASGLSEEEAATLFISRVREMNSILRDKTGGRHPEKLRDLTDTGGRLLVRRDQFEDIAETTMGDASIVYNPRELRFNDVLNVLDKSW